MTKRGEIFVGGHKMGLQEYFERRRAREEGHLFEEVRDSLRSLCKYVKRFVNKEYRPGDRIVTEYERQDFYRNRDRQENEFERRAVYDSMHDVKGKDWPGW